MSVKSAPEVLLLLPPLLHPTDYSSIKAIYSQPLSLTLKILGGNLSGRLVLDIVLPCLPFEQSSQLRKTLYLRTQQIIANVYKLTCILAAQHDIPLADLGDPFIDIRLLPASYSTNAEIVSRKSPTRYFGPVINIDCLAQSDRAWSRIVSVDSPQGNQILKTFLSTRGQDDNVICHKVTGGAVSTEILAHPMTMLNDSKPCRSVAVGGTFDHLHIGHKLLLTMTAFALDQAPYDELYGVQNCLTIGVTAADLLANKKFKEQLQTWHQRMEDTHNFLRGILCLPAGIQETRREIHKPGPNGHAVIVTLELKQHRLEIRYVEIWDPYGPTITDAAIDTLVVSGETRGGGQSVNEKRIEKGMTQLTVFEVDVLDATEEIVNASLASESFQNKLSSTEIRKHQAERRKTRSRV